MHILSLCILTSLFFFQACVSIPKDQACCQLLNTPCMEATIENALNAEAFAAGDFPNTSWWEMFDDPQLNHLIHLALCESPTLQAAKARVQMAEAQARLRKSQLFPTIGFNADINWQYLGENDFYRAFTPVFPSNITEYEIDINLQYELDFWGKNRNRFRAALGEAKALEAEKQGAILMLSTSVAAVYFKLQANTKLLKILKEERSVLTRLFQLTKDRQDNAIDTSMQRLTSEEALYAIGQNILYAQNRVALSKHMLHYLLGFGPEECEPIEEITLVENKPFPLPTHISSDFVARRPDLMAHLWRVEATAHNVGAAKADFYPRVDLTALAGLDSVFFQKLFSKGSYAANILPALHLPIFTAGRLRANLAAKQAEFEEQIFAYNDAVLSAVQQVADQIDTLKTASEALDVEDRRVENKLQNRKLIVARYKNAISSMIDLLGAQQEVLDKQLSQIKADYDRTIAAIELIKTLGGGYCTEEVPFE